MEQQHNNNNREEQEVDLVPVFVWIGNGFKNFFNAIGAFFKAIGHGILLFLAFIQANIILIGAFVIVGLALGFYLESSNKSNYAAQLRVAPNFKSATQLISNINFYNSLADEQDYDRLAKELKLSTEQAQQVKSFSIEPSYNDTELLEEYDGLARAADTMALNDFTFEGFKDAKREIDYEFYEITVKARTRSVLEKTIPSVVEVIETPGIKARRLASRETIEFNIESNLYQLQELDSLIVSYQKMIRSQTNSGGNTNLYLGDQQSSNNLMNLFYRKQSLLEDLEDLREDKYGSESTVNIVSQYIVQGSIKKEYAKLKLLIIFFVLGLLVAAAPSSWKFLKNYPRSTK
jgi:hypothetical protein